MASVYARAAVNGESISAGRTDIPFNFKSVNVTDGIFSLFLIGLVLSIISPWLVPKAKRPSFNLAHPSVYTFPNISLEKK